MFPLESGSVSQSDRNDSFHVAINEDNLDINKAYDFLRSKSCGAIYLFLGTVRTDEIDSDGKVIGQVDSLFYEAYDSMAIDQMNSIVQTVCRKYAVSKCYVVHRKGLIKVTEASLIIGCSSAHRDASFHATYDLLNEIKKSVPIWKKINYSADQKEQQQHSNTLHSEPESHQNRSSWSEKSEAFWLTQKKD
ncbi:molybdenum cofactor synthesis 2B [Brevipalpus obovatus]|uniref:molybdenum cofactor synthesis 2B n=1 Tax=Brevipalpus obovatus TaxID=246614 RepID=UPI003D9DC862